MNDEPDRLHALLMDLIWVAGVLHPDRATRGESVPLTHAFALHELDVAEPLSQRDLAQRLRLDKSTVSRLVADMAGEGLLERDRDPENRRYRRLRLTDRGRAAHARMATGLHRRYERLASGLTDAEREALSAGLPALVRVLRDELG